MNTNLVKGLKFLYEMEQSLYYMNRGYGMLQNEVDSLGKHKKLYEPKKGSSSGYSGRNVFFTSLVVCVIVGAIIGCIYGLFFIDNTFFRRIATGIVGIVYGVMYGAGGGAVIGIIAGIGVEIHDSKEREKNYQSAVVRYNSDVAADKKGSIPN